MLFTSEQVSRGHPDKICGQISDAILTDCLQHDRNSRVAVERLIKDEHITIAGELTSRHQPDCRRLVTEVLSRIGLPDPERYRLHTFLSRQSPDIALGVDRLGAGDQGVMFGYATNETPELLPMPFAVATRAMLLLRGCQSPLLLPDAKAQVSFDYDSKRISTFLISTQHRADCTVEDIRPVVESVMAQAALHYRLNTDFTVMVNPTGRFVIGSSFADTGVTGRKIIADTYGGMCRHRGGAFSGKDPTKMDRSGACAIGVAEPVSIAADCFGTARVPKEEIVKAFRSDCDLTPQGIIRDLRLQDVDYNLVSAYGYFGKPGLPWEQ